MLVCIQVGTIKEDTDTDRKPALPEQPYPVQNEPK
eukprot:COSAG02_NODE_6921_length_3286_cov_11.638700_1_plen_34_part_10